jgi:hypothetical protein
MIPDAFRNTNEVQEYQKAINELKKKRIVAPSEPNSQVCFDHEGRQKINIKLHQN